MACCFGGGAVDAPANPRPAPAPQAPPASTPNPLASTPPVEQPKPEPAAPAPITAKEVVSGQQGQGQSSDGNIVTSSAAQNAHSSASALPPWYNSPASGIRNSVHSDYLGTGNQLNTSDGLGSVNDILRLNLGEVSEVGHECHGVHVMCATGAMRCRANSSRV